MSQYRDERWRKLPLSDKQRDYLDRYKLPHPKNRGEATHAIYLHHQKRKELTAAVKKAEEEGGPLVVHMVDYASQPDLLIRCDRSWTTPDLKGPALPRYVYKAMNGRYYTFDDKYVTCKLCLETEPNGTPMAAE